MCAGAWGIVDNGYHNWSCTQAPSKVNLMRKEARFSEWLESMRKDVECAFGILKGRWRVLKTGIRLDGPEAADRVWLTCCALHNYLLEGNEEQSGEWMGAIGQNDVADMRRHAPFALQRLSNEGLKDFGGREQELEAAEAAAMERGERVAIDLENIDENIDEEETRLFQPIQHTPNGAIVINSLTHSDFRRRLVDHFDIMFRHKSLAWPTRMPPVDPMDQL